MRRKLGRNELARQAHFLKGGPTEKTGRPRRKARRRQDRLEEQDARLREDHYEDPDSRRDPV